MSKESIIKEMVSFIEDAERDLQASKLANEGKAGKTDIVNQIIKTLEIKTNDEN